MSATTPPHTISLELLRQRLAQNALLLADTLDDAIAEAPLNQRAAALGLLIDRLIKLDAWQPQERPEGVIRIEYQDPDGSVHQTPPWARNDP
jgi:hypothetical protein